MWLNLSERGSALGDSGLDGEDGKADVHSAAPRKRRFIEVEGGHSAPQSSDYRRVLDGGRKGDRGRKGTGSSLCLSLSSPYSSGCLIPR